MNVEALLPRILRICLIIIVARLAVGVGRSGMGKVLELKYRVHIGRAPASGMDKREATLIALAQSAITYIGYFVAILMILTELKLDVKGLLAGAGIVGIAVGFGAQNLVRDVIAGFFVVFERQFSVGDNVAILGFRGTVEEIGLRTTKLKAWTGERYTIPNGKIEEVTNYSIHNSLSVIDVTVAYGEDPERVQGAIREMVEGLCRSIPEVVKAPEVLGVEDVKDFGMIFRIAVEVLPMQHFKVARILRKGIREGMVEQGISIPVPKFAIAENVAGTPDGRG